MINICRGLEIIFSLEKEGEIKWRGIDTEIKKVVSQRRQKGQKEKLPVHIIQAQSKDFTRRKEGEIDGKSNGFSLYRCRCGRDILSTHD